VSATLHSGGSPESRDSPAIACDNAEMTTVATGAEGAREAVSRYSWREAFDLFAAADAVAPLDPDDLDLMAECAWWIGKMRHCIALRERAHTAYVKAGNLRRAAAVGAELADHHGDLGEVADAQAWIQKSARMLEGLPEGVEHGWLNLVMAMLRRHEGDLEGALVFTREAAALGARYGDKDLFALGHAFSGICIAFTGDPDRGLPMVEEATHGAVNGELGARATGSIYCMMIAVNAQLADWQTAGHWSEAATNWCNRQAINGFPGICRVHRAEIMRLRGAFSDAEEEARVATGELASFNLEFTALAFRELGEIRVKMGDFEAAEDAFRQAQELGVTPQPGMALLLLERGRPQAAATALRRALAGHGLGALDRAKLLPAQLDVALLLDDADVARAAAAELDIIAQAHSAPALRATADSAAAAVALVDGELDEAERAARRGKVLFDGIDLAYESARVSVLLGRIAQARGDLEAAHAEVQSGLATFEEIGALPDAQRTRALLAELN
jgi:tetratricopeptide (TPR) repeat protein